MDAANLEYTRRMLKKAHQDASYALRMAGVIANNTADRALWNAASVTGGRERGGRNKTFAVHIQPRTMQNKYTLSPMEDFHWSDRAYNAYEARAKAWNAFIRARFPQPQ